MLVDDTYLNSLTAEDYKKSPLAEELNRDYNRNSVNASLFKDITLFSKKELPIIPIEEVPVEDLPYKKGVFVFDNDGIVYQSLADDNIYELDDNTKWALRTDILRNDYFTNKDLEYFFETTKHLLFKEVKSVKDDFKKLIFFTLLTHYLKEEYDSLHGIHGITTSETHAEISKTIKPFSALDRKRYAQYIRTKYGQRYVEYLNQINRTALQVDFVAI